MALFKHLLAFALAARLRSKRLIIIFIRIALLIELSLAPAFAYDNSVFPEFAIAEEKRRFAWLSIHPDEERWLITECTDQVEPSQTRCLLFIYNIKTKTYHRLDLADGYNYLYGEFSPSGKQIVAIRIPVPRDGSYAEAARVSGESQILLMNADGQRPRVTQSPKGRLRAPTFSQDETKIAYWSAARIRPEGSKTFMSDFDLHEHDLQGETDRLFSGQFHFFSVGRINYKNKDQIVADADGFLTPQKSRFFYSSKFNFSGLYCFDRNVTSLEDPCLTEIPHARHSSIDSAGNVYLQGQHEKFGMSLYKLSHDGQTQHWRMPAIHGSGIRFQTISASGRQLGFIYSTVLSRSENYQSGIGYFDLSTERWIPLHVPASKSAMTLRPVH